jgi:hypothetical protein
MQNMTDKYSGPKLISIDGDKTDPAVDFDTEPNFEKNDLKKRGRYNLTNKQRSFVANMLAGAGSQSAAYKIAYDIKTMSDHAVGVEASRLMRNPSVSRALTAGYKRQEEQSLHSGASLRLLLEKKLLEKIETADSDANILKAIDLLGRSEKVGYFLDRSQDLTAEELSAEEVRDQLEDKLKRAFDQ